MDKINTLTKNRVAVLVFAKISMCTLNFLNASSTEIADRRALYHRVIQDGDLNVNSPFFDATMDRFCERGFTLSDDDDESDEELRAENKVQKKALIKTFLQRPDRSGTKRVIIYPEEVYNARDNWHGPYKIVPLNRGWCQHRETPEGECQRFLLDNRVVSFTLISFLDNNLD
jgi:hypothetical protein